MGPKKLADDLEVSEEEANGYLDEFKLKFTRVMKFFQKCLDEARKAGYIKTITGRRRYFHNINSSNNDARSASERAAMNSIFQGSGADLVKMAMIKICTRISEFMNPVTNMLAGTSPLVNVNAPRLLVQIHDELLFEVPDENLADIVKIVRECMGNATSLSVPLLVKIQTGKSWGKLKLYRH